MTEGRELRDEMLQELYRGAEARFERGEDVDEADVVLVALAHPETYEIQIRTKGE